MKKKQESGVPNQGEWNKPLPGPPKHDFTDFSKIGKGPTVQPTVDISSTHKKPDYAGNILLER